MQDFVSFWGELFRIVSEFLMSSPIKYFTATLLMILIAGFIRSLISWNRGEK